MSKYRQVSIYASLWCKSNYSFLEGASHPEELMETACRYGLPALAVTDRQGVYGLPRAHQKNRELGGSRLISGSQLTVRDEGVQESLVVLVQSGLGWKNLCRLLTLGARRAGKGESELRVSDIAERSEGLLALWGGGADSALLTLDEELWWSRGGQWREIFGKSLYTVLSRHHQDTDRRRHERIFRRSLRLGVSVAAVREVLYHQGGRRRLQDVLTCVREGVTLERAGCRLRANGDHQLLAPEAFLRLYEDQPEAVRRTLEIAERCQFNLSELDYRYPDEPLPAGKTSSQWLRELAYEGAQQKYTQDLWPQVEAQLEKELSVILGLGYVGYFLTMKEIVDYCRSQGILCQGRGSAANSIVCYCLGVTAVDPLKLGLLFERFLSTERAEPPDIDLDIMHQRREEVISWVYQRYGREHAAMVCNVVRYRTRSAVREVGKVLGVETPVIERLSRLLSGYSPGLEEETLELVGLPKDVPIYRLLLSLVNELLDFPRHLSIHPGGFLLGGEPVSELVPVENATMEGRTVIQWDKYDVESLGLFKVDLLGLGALSHLDRAFSLLRLHRGVELSMESLPVEDELTYDMLCRGDSVGVFQIESRAQMAMLPTLRPRRFYDLVIQVAIIRPGPITGGMVHPYLRRRVGQEEITYPHSSLIPVLEKTLGIPLFQEQVMRLAVVAADYTPGEADQLRRDMAAWRSRGKLEKHRDKLLSRMKEKGISEEFAERVFAQIQGFGEYGFPESHAASFALITYATSYVRAHYPAEFTCALLNSLPMGFYSAFTLVEDAKRRGVEVRTFCAERSDWECTLEPLGPERFALRLGLRFMKGLSEAFVERLRQERPFRSVRELTLRAHPDRRALEILASGGALEVYGGERRSQLWATDDHLMAKALPLLADWKLEERRFEALSHDEEVVWDFEVSGLSSRGHPMASLRRPLASAGYLTAEQLHDVPHGGWAKVAAMVICRQRPATAKGTVFLTLEDETGFINVILWPKVFEKNLVIARSSGLLAVEGKVQSGQGVTHLVAIRLSRPDLETAVEIGSRNFH